MQSLEQSRQPNTLGQPSSSFRKAPPSCLRSQVQSQVFTPSFHQPAELVSPHPHASCWNNVHPVCCSTTALRQVFDSFPRMFRRQYVERTKYIFKSRSSSDNQSGCNRKPSRSGAGFVRRSPVGPLR
ncbi:hypothetical protein BST61_g11171 [Cercospora zeina]